MKINSIKVVVGRCFNHPFEQYSNLKPEVTLTATLEEGEDANAAARQLQQQAETLVEDHKQAMLKSIHDLQILTEHKQRIASLGDSIRRNQQEVETLRSQYPELQQLELS